MADKELILYVYDQSFTLKAIVDSYSSLIWSDRYNQCGDFELQVVFEDKWKDILQKDYFCRIDFSDHWAIIEKIEQQQEMDAPPTMIVSGRSIECILERRIITAKKESRNIMILKANNEKNEVTFDLAGINDIEELIRLRVMYMIDDFGSITEDEERFMRKQLPDYFRRKLGKEVVAFVARAEGRLVACALLLVLEKPANPFLPNGFEGDVVGVYTEEKYRNRGICTTLMKNLVEYSKEHDLCRIELMATDEGYPIYKSIGFADKVQKYRDMRFVIK